MTGSPTLLAGAGRSPRSATATFGTATSAAGRKSRRASAGEAGSSVTWARTGTSPGGSRRRGGRAALRFWEQGICNDPTSEPTACGESWPRGAAARLVRPNEGRAAQPVTRDWTRGGPRQAAQPALRADAPGAQPPRSAPLSAPPAPADHGRPGPPPNQAC